MPITRATTAWMLRNAGLAAAYVAGASLGMGLLFDQWSATVWPPSGIALAGILLGGPQLWPGVAIASLVVNGTELLQRDASFLFALQTAAWIGLGNTLQAVLGARLVRSVVEPPQLFDQTRNILWFIVTGAVLSSTVSSTFATEALVAAGQVHQAEFSAFWFNWWLGNVLGTLVFAPVVIAWGTGLRATHERTAQRVEWVILVGGLGTVSALVFGWQHTTDLSRYPLVYLPMPFLGWAALRIGARATVVANALLVTIAVATTVRGLGPFVQGTPRESLLLLQAFAGFVGTTSLLLACVVAEREHAAVALRRAAESLEGTVAARTAELRGLSARLRSIREEERRYIATELHDALGQSLTALNMDAAWVAQQLPQGEPRLLARTRGMRASIDAIIRSIRRIASDLRPSVLDNLGLPEALAWQLREFQGRADIRCTQSIQADDLEIEPERAVDVFRIVQEALTNVARHAHATRVHLDVRELRELLVVEVADDGRGIPPGAADDPGSLGIVGMRERIARWDGSLEIAGRAGGGTIVRLECPLGRARARSAHAEGRR